MARPFKKRRSCARYVNENEDQRNCEWCDRVNTKTCPYPELTRDIKHNGTYEEPTKPKKKTYPNQKKPEYRNNPYNYMTQRRDWDNWNLKNVKDYISLFNDNRPVGMTRFKHPRHCMARMRRIYKQVTWYDRTQARYKSKHIPIGYICEKCNHIKLDSEGL